MQKNWAAWTIIKKYAVYLKALNIIGQEQNLVIRTGHEIKWRVALK